MEAATNMPTTWLESSFMDMSETATLSSSQSVAGSNGDRIEGQFQRITNLASIRPLTFVERVTWAETCRKVFFQACRRVGGQRSFEHSVSTGGRRLFENDRIE